MRVRIVLIGMLLLLFITALRAQKSADDLFQRASVLEAKGDTQGAMQIYKRIVQDFPSNRNLAAKATIHLAQLSDVMGQNVARSYYEDIVKNYQDQTAIAAAARKWLDSHTNTRIEIATPFTKDPWSFALSPDGKNLVFLVTNGGTSSLWLHRLDTGKQGVIPGTESSSYSGGPTSVVGANPFWSPDGRFIAYFEDRKLKTISVDGGIPKPLASAPFNTGGTWNAAGDIVFGKEVMGPLFQVSANGTYKEVQVSYLDSETSAHRYPSFFPDGRNFLMYPRTPNTGTIGFVMIGSLDGGGQTKLPLSVSGAAFAPPNHLVFAVGSALHTLQLDPRTMKLAGSPVLLADRVAVYTGASGRVAFSVSNAGPIAYRQSIAARRRVVWRDALGKVTGIGNEAPTEYLTGTPRFSSNGHDVSFARTNFTLNFTVLNTNTGGFRNIDIGRHISTGESPIWSPDGTSFVFADDGAGTSFPVNQLFTSAGPTGSAPVLISAESKVPTDWHGDYVLFNLGNSGPTANRDLMVLSVHGGTPPIPIAANTWNEGNGRFSPDGKWIVYESDELNGRPEIFVQPFPGTANDRRRVSISGGTKAQWSWDGTSIYFLSPDSQLMAAGFTVSADSSAPVIKKPVSLFSVPVDSTYAPAPDGRFLMSEPTERVPPIYVLLNPFGAKP